MEDFLTNRQQWMKLFSLSPECSLAELFQDLDLMPRLRVSLGPETGLITVRGRISNEGDLFNVGDASVTKTEVILDNHIKGLAFTLGASKEKSLHAAGLDAVMQSGPDVPTQLRIKKLALELQDSRLKRAAQVTKTKVDFFTMVRGE